jgi:hypothetical protein
MRKKMLFLALALAATAVSLTAPRAQAFPLGGGGPWHSCPMCTTFPDGSQCCINCSCSSDGSIMLCPENACAQVGGLG